MTYTIMVGVDGDAEHRACLRWAAARAARDGARLELVFVIERSWGDGAAGDGMDVPGRRLELAAKSVLAAEREVALHDAAAAGSRLASARERVPATASVAPDSAGPAVAPPQPPEIGTRYVYGHVGTELAFASRDADLLVVGTRNGVDDDHAFTGSLAVRVAATAACPVAVVPHGWDGDGSGVVAGVDGHLPSELAVAFAADEAEALGEPLTVACAGYTANPLLAGFVPEISLGDRREHVVDVAARQAREAHPDLDVRTRVLEAAPSRGLLSAARGSRLLVVGTRNRHGLKRVMLGSVSHDVLLNVSIPVVVVRDRGEEPGFEEHTR